MKSLLEFKSAVNEEKSDYSKFDVLVRAGLANKAQMQRIHKILDKMQEEKPVFKKRDKGVEMKNKIANILHQKNFEGIFNKNVYLKQLKTLNCKPS